MVEVEETLARVPKHSGAAADDEGASSERKD